MWYHKNTTFEKNCQYPCEIFIELPINIRKRKVRAAAGGTACGGAFDL